MKWILIFLMALSSFAQASELSARAEKEHWHFKWKEHKWHRARGLHQDLKKMLDSLSHVDIHEQEALPAAFQLSGLTPVHDQGQCGSCWAFASAGAIENAPGNKGTALSPQYLMDCDSGSFGCGGGYFDALDVAKTGIPSWKSYPYLVHNSRCKSAQPAAQVNEWQMIGDGQNSPSTEQIKTALLATKTPIVVTVFADGAFESYQGGVYDACRQGQTNHMVNIVGWDDSKQSWLVRNSWSGSWGDKGYIWMVYTDRRGNKCNNIGEDAAQLESVKFF